MEQTRVSCYRQEFILAGAQMVNHNFYGGMMICVPALGVKEGLPDWGVTPRKYLEIFAFKIVPLVS